MVNLVRFLLLTLLFFSSRPCFAEDWDLQTVLDRLVHTYGGEKSLQKMDSMVQEWNMVALMSKAHGTDVRSFRAPFQLRVILSYPNKQETRILDGDAAYYQSSNHPSEAVTGMRRDAMRLQLMRLYSPLTLRSKMESMSLLEQDDLLALSLAENGVHVHYLVNKENFHIEKVAGVLNMGGQEIRFLTEYSDFAVIDGVLVHQAENKFANGVNTAKLKLSRITFDAPLDGEMFKP
jgi:hypothetical protein